MRRFSIPTTLASLVLGTMACPGTAWGQGASARLVRRFTDSTIVRQGLLGFSTAINDSSAFAGAPAGTTQPGLGSLFDIRSFRKIRAVAPSVQRNDSLYGYSADAAPGRFVVGDPGNSTSPVKVAGAVYLHDSATGSELHRLQPADSRGGDEFGYGVSVYGSYVAIGAPEMGTGPGAAYLFHSQSGAQLRKLVPLDPLAGSEFGVKVAVNSRFTLVGAPGNANVLGFTPGHAYVFDTQTGQQLFKLQANDGFGGDEFGFDVAIQGNQAVIGAPNSGIGKGAAYLFDLTTGTQISKLIPTDGVLGNDFGSAVDIFDDKIVVGANGGGQLGGAVYVFDALLGRQAEKIKPAEVADGDAFGFSVSVYGEDLLVGSPRDDETNTNAGMAYLFELAPITVLGDFDRNGRLDLRDINRLSTEYRAQRGDSPYNLIGARTIDQDDRAYWVENLANTYFGDANLDGKFSSEDMIRVFTQGHYENGRPLDSQWEHGDWDGDGDVTSSDLILALQTDSYEKGPRNPRSAVSAVPEPTMRWLMVSSIIFVTVTARRRNLCNRT